MTVSRLLKTLYTNSNAGDTYIVVPEVYLEDDAERSVKTCVGTTVEHPRSIEACFSLAVVLTGVAVARFEC